MARIASAALLCLLCTSGCLEEQRYAVERERLALPPGATPAFVDDDDNPIFVVQRTFRLPIRPPSSEVLQALAQGAQGKDLPFPRLPWVQREDLELRIDYVVENNSDQAVTALVFVDGINEFFVYTPGPEDFHQYERRLLVEPGQRVEGTITELEMDEVAIDLATAVNGAPNTALVVQFQGQSGRDPRVAPYIPSVIPALVGFNMGLQTGALGDEDAPPALVLRLSARVQDHGDRITARGERSWELPTPAPFVPVVPQEEP